MSVCVRRRCREWAANIPGMLMLGFKTMAAPSTSPLVIGDINDDENSTNSSLVPLTHSFKTQRTSSTWFSFQVFRKERLWGRRRQRRRRRWRRRRRRWRRRQSTTTVREFARFSRTELPERYDAYLLTKPTLVLCSSVPSSCIGNKPLVLLPSQLPSRNLAGQVFVVQQTVKIDFRCTWALIKSHRAFSPQCSIHLCVHTQVSILDV